MLSVLSGLLGLGLVQYRRERALEREQRRAQRSQRTGPFAKYITADPRIQRTFTHLERVGDSTASIDDDGLIGNPFGSDVNWLDGLTLEVDDQTMRIYEVAIGAEWSRCTCSGARLYARAVLEAQTWEVPFLVDTSFGFVGPSFAIGIER